MKEDKSHIDRLGEILLKKHEFLPHVSVYEMELIANGYVPENWWFFFTESGNERERRQSCGKLKDFVYR